LYTRVKKGTNKSIYLAEVISAIGHGIRNRHKLKKDSALAAKAGAFLLYTFQELKILEVFLGQSDNGHNAYVINVLDDSAISKLWSDLESKSLEKLPLLEPAADWIAANHATGITLVKTEDKEVLKKLSVENQPMLFRVINRKQKVGWLINDSIAELQAWALRNRAAAFNDIWDNQSAEARTTKLREAKVLSDISKRLSGKTFYHIYTVDFRGRIYPSSAYLTEQGTDVARGLLVRKEKKKIGSAGFFWLTISIASNWAGDAGREDKAKTDKIPLESRHLWVLDNEEIILSYADSPKVNQGWMGADKPWQFLRGCQELLALRKWQMEHEFELDNYDFESNYEVYIDGLKELSLNLVNSVNNPQGQYRAKLINVLAFI
jgi:DNA-directed RNA polymerase